MSAAGYEARAECSFPSLAECRKAAEALEDEQKADAA